MTSAAPYFSSSMGEFLMTRLFTTQDFQGSEKNSTKIFMLCEMTDSGHDRGMYFKILDEIRTPGGCPSPIFETPDALNGVRKFYFFFVQCFTHYVIPVENLSSVLERFRYW